MSAKQFGVCFVYTGNICRSLTAAGVFMEMAAKPLPGLIVDSAGTHGYHVGERPDPRAIAAAARRGYDISGLRARKFERSDFDRFDLVVVMDHGHKTFLARIAEPSQEYKLKMMMAYSRRFGEIDVPDPYYGGTDRFERVLDLIEDAAMGLVEALATILNQGESA